MKEIQFIDRKTGKLIIEHPPGENFLKFLYHHPFGKLSLELLVKRKVLTSYYGSLMNKSGSKKRIKPFVEQYNIDMSEAQKHVDEFTSFNDFFYRKLKLEARPIENGFVSPADGKLLAFDKIDYVNEFFVKGNRFSLSNFLNDKSLVEKYQEGSMLIVRLAPNDYHRFHFPYAGKAMPAKQIAGYFYSVSPYAVLENFTKVFCGNKRELVTLQTKDKGDVLICPVGATMVGSIIETYASNTEINKGDEMGYFAFGGSSIVVLLEKDALKVDKDILENTINRVETAVIFGEQIGV